MPQFSCRFGESRVMLHALIPAAGHSARMGAPKLALPLGARTVLERVIDALNAADAQTLVVLGPHVADLAKPAREAGANVLLLSEPTADMRETVEAGLAHLHDRLNPEPDDIWLLIPADHPTLDPDLIRKLYREIEIRPDCSIAMPTIAGRRGHPALIRWRHWPAIRAFPRDRGLNAYLRQFPNETLEVSVDSPDILIDLDTPEDYERLRRRFE
jgi:molybdenum cofactor cytidylyltransferase